jgi:hypothetical protein
VEVHAQASSWEEDMRRLAGAADLARAASDRRPDLAAAEAMGDGAAGLGEFPVGVADLVLVGAQTYFIGSAGPRSLGLS